MAAKTMLKLLRSVSALSIFLLVFHSIATLAQDDVRAFKFSGEGKFMGFADPGIKKGKRVRVQLPGNKDVHGNDTWLTYTFSEEHGKYKGDPSDSNNTMTLPDSVILGMNKHLAARIDIALDNLDDSIPLQEFYQGLWSKAEYEKVRSHAERLDTVLQDAPKFAHLHDSISQWPEFADLNFLEDSLKKRYRPYSITVKFNPDSARYEVSVTKVNPFQSVLLSYWTRVLGNFHYSGLKRINHFYRDFWDQIGAMAIRAKYWYNALEKFNILTCTQPRSIDSLVSAADSFIDSLKQNKIVQVVAGNALAYKGVFWWNDGFFSFNPLGLSTLEHTLHAFRYDKVAADLHDRIAKGKIDDGAFCCNLSINSIDSLILVRNMGEKIFSTDTTVVDPIWGLNDLHALRTTQKLVNQFEVPVEVNRGQPQFYLQFDADRNYYASPENRRYRRMTAADSLSFVIHNIAANTTLVVNQVSQPTTNTSSFQDAVASLSGVSGLNTAGTAVGLSAFVIQAGSAYLSSDLSSYGLASGNAVTKAWAGGGGSRPAVRTRGLFITLDLKMIGTKTFEVTPSTSEGDLLATYNALLPASLQDSRAVQAFVRNGCFLEMDFGQQWDRPGFKTAAEEYLKALIDAYVNFVKENRLKQQKLLAKEDSLISYKYIVYLSMITDRSLPPPPDSLSALTDSVPAYRTQIFPVPVYDSTRAVQATIVAKKIVKKDTTTITHPIYPPIRIGTLSRFAFSAGIAVTPGFYFEKTATSAGGHLTVNNNAALVGYMVGLHIYPWRYFPLDNSFLGFKTNHFWQRVSVYTGVALPNPLQDYYGGLSFDLVPGFKLVTGAHLYLNTRYQIVNNQIASQASAVKYAGTFVSFCIDPSAFVTVLGLFK